MLCVCLFVTILLCFILLVFNVVSFVVVDDGCFVVVAVVVFLCTVTE